MTAPHRGPAVATLAGATADVRAAVWLRLRHLRLPLHVAVLAAIVGAAYLGALAFVAQWAYDREAVEPQMVLAFLTPAWLLWALLPAFGGGGEIDSPRYLDPYPLRPTFLVVSSLTSTAADVQYLFIAPAATAACYAAWGWPGVAGALLFIAGAAAVGQVCVWTVTAWPTRQWLTISVLSVVLVGIASLLKFHPEVGPAGWLVTAMTSEGTSRTASVAALLAPFALFGLAIAPLARATLRSRGERAAAGRTITGLNGILPVYRAHLYSIWRSNTAKITLFSALIIPLVIDAALPGATTITVLMFVVGAGGAIIATNAYSYDHTGTLWLLAFPRRRWALLVAKVAAVLTWFAILTIPATAVAVGIGMPLSGRLADPTGFVAATVALMAAVIVAGIGTTVRRPCEADHDTLRVRPAPVPSVIGYGLRLGFLLLFLAPVGNIFYPAGARWSAAVVVALYTVLVLGFALRTFRDGAALSAAFKV